MGNTAIMHLPGDFGEIQLVINDQFLYPLNFVGNDISLDGTSLNF